MQTDLKSGSLGIKIDQLRSNLAPRWRKWVALSIVLLGLAVFVGAEYQLGTTIASGSYILAMVLLLGIGIVAITIASPLWGYSIWFFMSCYLTLFDRVLPRKFNFDMIMLGLLVMALGFRALAKKTPIRRPSIEEIFLILAFIYEYVLRHEFYKLSDIVVEIRFLLVSPCIFYFIAKSVITKKKHIYWLMIVVIVTGFSWALMGIYEQIVQKMWLAGLMGEDAGLYAGIRSAGPAGFYYLYGNMLILTILLCLHLLGWLHKFHAKLVLLVACLTTGLGLYYGYSRAPYIAFALSLIMMAFLAKRTKLVYVSFIILLTITAATVVVPHIQSDSILTKRFTTGVDTRLATNITSANMFKANWLFGVGTGKYGDNIWQYVHRGHRVTVNPRSGLRNDYSTSHSEYYLKLCELGIVGFMLYFGTYALFAYRAIKLRTKLPESDIMGRDLACLTAAFSIAVLFTMLTDQFAINQFMYAIIFTLYAMLQKSGYYAQEEPAKRTAALSAANLQALNQS